MAGAAAAALLGFGSACDKMPLTAPSGTSLTLIAATNVLPVNGSTEITAILIEGGQATTGTGGQTTTTGIGTPVHNGTLVTFTTSLGRVEPAEARTTGGRATVRLIADGRSGVATVTAFSGAATDTAEISVGAAGATRVVLTASPQSLPPNGGQTTVFARVEDEQGNGLLGVPVSFTTSAGSISPTSAVTNESGVATTTLSALTAATVTANAGATTGTVTVAIKSRTDLTIEQVTPTAAVSVPVTFRFGVLGTGTAISNATVDWDDGTSSDLGTLSGTRTVTHLFGQSGALSITLSGNDAEGVRTSVSTEIVVTPLTMTVTASAAAPTFGTPVTFTATVAPAGASIERYEWDLGEGDLRTSQSAQITYSFQSRGTKTVTVRAIPTRGSPVVALTQVEVK